MSSTDAVEAWAFNSYSILFAIDQLFGNNSKEYQFFDSKINIHKRLTVSVGRMLVALQKLLEIRWNLVTTSTAIIKRIIRVLQNSQSNYKSGITVEAVFIPNILWISDFCNVSPGKDRWKKLLDVCTKYAWDACPHCVETDMKTLSSNTIEYYANEGAIGNLRKLIINLIHTEESCIKPQKYLRI